MTTPERARKALYDAVRSHTSELENARGAASGFDRQVPDRELKAARRLLEWLSQALELDPPASPAVQTPPPSSSPLGSNTAVHTRSSKNFSPVNQAIPKVPMDLANT
jgi:hypothetical protein